MGPKAAAFYHNGLGDGVNCLVLSNNLHLNGWQVDTYHNGMGSMQNWFPHLPILSYPPLEELPRILSSYDLYLVVHNDTCNFVQKLIAEGKRRFPERIKVIYLYPSKRIVREPYYADCLIDPSSPVAENMCLFCQRLLHLPKSTKSNGFIPPEGLVHRKFPQRILIHPTSAKKGRCWPKEKFVKLALHLKEEGYEPVFTPGDHTKWGEFPVAHFPDLDQLARYIYESGYLIGNDSGLGHLASALQIPTLILFRRKTHANLWAPSFYKGITITPSSWIPNIRGFRLRDRLWKRFISVNKARRGFEHLVQTTR